MRNLLHANLRRMVRSKAFLFAVLAELAYTALVVLVCWDHYAAGTAQYTLESVLTAGFGLMGYFPIPSLIAAPLLSLHLGTDYSDNTLRNKLIVGHTRTEIYLADLLTCMISAVGLDILYLVLSGVLCAYPILGMSGGVLLRVPPGQMLAWTGAALLARAAWAAVVKLAVTLLGNRTTASIAGLLLVLAAAGFCAFGFNELEYLARHPEAVNLESRMSFWRLALDVLPTGQYLQISRLDTPNLWRMPLLSLAVIAAGTGAGLLLFRRRDLK